VNAQQLPPTHRTRSAEETYPALPLPLSQAWRALVALCIGFFMILLDQTIVAVATPAFQVDLHADYGQVLWVTSAYLLTFAVPLMVTGRLGDRFGPKNLYIAGMTIFTLSSLACGLAGSIEMLIAARAVQGIGGSLLTPQTMSVINRIFPRDKRGAALGIWGATAGISTLAGPLLGGLITEYATWHWVFFINVPIGVLSVVMVARWVPRFRPTRDRINVPSILLSMVAMTMVIYGIQEGDPAGWAPWIWALLVGGVAMMIAFVWLQSCLSAGSALVPIALFARRHFAFGNASIFTMGFTIAGMMVPVMLFLQEVHRFGPMKASFVVTPMAIIAGVMAPFVGRLVDRYDPRRFAVLGFCLMAIGVAALALSMRPERPLWMIIGSFVILGFGNAFVWAPNSTATLRDLPPQFAGAGSGMYNATRQLGAVTGAAVIAAVVQARVSVVGPQAFGESLLPAVVMLILGALASSVARQEASHSDE